ncbi:hypothetical protein [Streptomyces parvulus]|uniref:hypothetical protein n=1 Tax=Streptomyces parvulus TaxID=146923 RepID=UPI003793177C
MAEESSYESADSEGPSRPQKSASEVTSFAKYPLAVPNLRLPFQSAITEMFRQQNARTASLISAQLPNPALGFQSAITEAFRQQNARTASLISAQLPNPALGFQSAITEAFRQQNARTASLISAQLPNPALGFQSAITEMARLHTESLRAGFGSALTDAIKAASLQRTRTVSQFADLAKSASAFSTGLSGISSWDALNSRAVFSSALKLSRLYEDHPAFQGVTSQAALFTVSTVEPELVDASAQPLVEDEAGDLLDVAELADELIKRLAESEKGPGERASGFRVGNISPGALVLGVLVLLYSGASDAAGILSPGISDLLDRQFTYASLAMATLYFLYQEGKR